MGPGFMVYLICSVFGLDGRDDSKNGLKWLHSAPLHADVRSQLAGSSAIQPFAASEENWHPVIFIIVVNTGRIIHSLIDGFHLA